MIQSPRVSLRRKPTSFRQVPLIVQRHCLLMTTDPGDLVLDPTCGSGTTAYVAELWGRRWITIDTSRVALALARTRLMAARFPYYLLADSPEGRKKQAELSAKPTPADAPPARRDVRQGFVYRTVPHVTLKSIANNPDMKGGGMARRADRRGHRPGTPTRRRCTTSPTRTRGPSRLTGPFTVESLSPHRMLPAGDGGPGTPNGAPADSRNYTQSMLDNLRKAGVKGTVRAQRIAFERLDSFPGEYIQAEGVTDAGRRGAGPALARNSAPSATSGSRRRRLEGDQEGRPLRPAAGVRASPSRLASTSRRPNCPRRCSSASCAMLPVRMNPDLAMGDELLKKTGAGNLFTVFGKAGREDRP